MMKSNPQRTVHRETLIYATYYAPRGRNRLYLVAAELSQKYLTPTDLVIGVLGAEGSGKSTLIKGLFPGPGTDQRRRGDQRPADAAHRLRSRRRVLRAHLPYRRPLRAGLPPEIRIGRADPQGRQPRPPGHHRALRPRSTRPSATTPRSFSESARRSSSPGRRFSGRSPRPSRRSSTGRSSTG